MFAVIALSVYWNVIQAFGYVFINCVICIYIVAFFCLMNSNSA